MHRIAVLWGRAEDYAHDPLYREQFPLVVSRAVAALPVLVEIALPFVQKFGFLIAYKGPKAEIEIKQAQQALSLVGGQSGWRAFDRK
ncbi:MAG: hypothetical protein GX764_02185, partial [Firmicutes bacterium]|nr:hypothetical protein [Bacillota bacterium]